MSKLQVDNIYDKAGTGAPTFPNGTNITGVATATTFKGAVTGNVTGNASGTAGGLSGNPDITVGKLTINNDATVGGALTVTGNLKVDGTQTIINTQSLEVEDKTVGVGSTSSPTNTTADGCGLVVYGATEKSLKWGNTGTKWTLAGGGLDLVDVNVSAAATVGGLATFSGGVGFNGGGVLKEKVKITAGKLSDNLNINLADGMVHYFTTQETAQATPNIRVDGSTTLASKMAVGEQIAVTVITTAASAAYSANWQIDGSNVTENWTGGSAPSGGGSSGVDIYSLNIIKTAATPSWTVIATQTKTS